MKIKFLVILLLAGQVSSAQSSITSSSIDTSNYYNFVQHGTGISINWLREIDAIPIIIEELLKNGIPYYEISLGKLVKINDSTRFVVQVSFEKGDKTFGFLYEADHGIPLSYSDRDFFIAPKKAYYVQSEKDIRGHVKFMRIDPIPAGIFLIKETCYWYQYDAKGTKYPVSKDIAQKILRQDVNNYLKML